jgi:hypothetical protein
MTELTGTFKAAALHGIAMNKGYSTEMRLRAALQALKIYEAEWERINDKAQDPVGDSR